MLNDYKPTHDPNIDTFKVQYLLGISAVLAILFPRDYRISEVGCILSMEWEKKPPRLMSCRYFGPFPSGWSRWPYCHSYSCYNEPGRQTPSPPTIFLPWDSIGHSTSRTGSSAISPKPPSNVHSSLWPLSPESSKRCFTPTSFTFTTTSKPNCLQQAKDRRVVQALTRALFFSSQGSEGQEVLASCLDFFLLSECVKEFMIS